MIAAIYSVMLVETSGSCLGWAQVCSIPAALSVVVGQKCSYYLQSSAALRQV